MAGGAPSGGTPDLGRFFGFGGGGEETTQAAAPAPALAKPPAPSQLEEGTTVAPPTRQQVAAGRITGIETCEPPQARTSMDFGRSSMDVDMVGGRKASVNKRRRKSSIDRASLDDRMKALNEEQERLEEEAEWPRFVIDHESQWYIYWVGLMTLCGFYSCFIVGYQIGFYDSYTSFDTLLVIEWVIDVAFILDLISGFFVSYFVQNVKIVDRRMIARRLVRKPRLACDFLACLPLDFIQAATGWTPLSRANKLLRLWSLAHHMHVLANYPTQTKVRNMLRVVRLVIVWLLIPHLLSCARLLIIRLDPLEPVEIGRWKPAPGVENEPLFTQYLHSYYWCMALMTGFGDGNIPENMLQYAFTLSVLNVGLFCFAYTVGVLGAIGSQGAAQANEFQVLVKAVKEFISQYQFSESLQERITTYLHHRWATITSGSKELVDAAELLDQLPRTMRYEAVESLTMETLAKVPLFARVEEGFMHALTQKMQAINASIGETLVRQGESNDAFYIVLKGRLSVEIDNHRQDDLTRGSFFGERTMMGKTAARATITSMSFCELYRLHKEDLQTLRINFPDTFGGFEQAAKLEQKNAERAARSRKAGPTGSMQRETKTTRFLVHPNSRTRVLWAFLLYLSLAYDAFMLPIKLVFVGNNIHPTLMGLDILFDLLLLLDAFAQFRLAYTLDGRIVTDLKEIRLFYMYGLTDQSPDSERQNLLRGTARQRLSAMASRGSFLPILVSSLPWCLLSPFFAIGADARALQSVRLVRLLRMLPRMRTTNRVIIRQQPTGLDELLRLVRKSPFDLQYTAHQMLPLLAAYLLLAHYVACGYWATVIATVPPFDLDHGVLYLPESAVTTPELIAHMSAAEALGNATTSGGLYLPWADGGRVSAILVGSEWLPHYKYLSLGHVVLWYFRALYFSVCNLTGLGKSPVPFKNLPLAYTTITFIVGVLVFAYITSSIVTLVMNANAPYVRYQEKRNALLGFMDSARVDPTVVTRAGRWMEHWWYAHGGIPASYVLDQLPPSMGHEVRYLIFQKTTQNSKVFMPLWEHLKKKPGGGKCARLKAAAGQLTPGAVEEEEKQARVREALTRELVNSMEFEVFNPGEWVIHKGSLNEWLYIITVGTAQVLLVEADDEELVSGRNDRRTTKRAARTTKVRTTRAGSSYKHLSGKVVAELDVGDVFGEISVMYRNKCEASIRAKTPLELISIPRWAIMKALHRNNNLMQGVLALIKRRRKENDYYKMGDTTVKSTVIAMIAAHKLAKWIRKRMANKSRASYRLAHPEEFPDEQPPFAPPPPAPTASNGVGGSGDAAAGSGDGGTSSGPSNDAWAKDPLAA